MPDAATLSESLAPFTSDPDRSAVMFDVDGTLAPIVRHAEDAHVPESTRSLLIPVARRYGLVACVSGRRASDARRIVSIGSIAYLGSHGSEMLRPGMTAPEIDRQLGAWVRRVRRFAQEAYSNELLRLRVRTEDKGAIAAFHWRGAPDEEAAHAAVEEVAAAAEADGLRTHWGRKVLEIRPPVRIDKGHGITRLLRGSNIANALYAGDDATDVDAFRALRELVADGMLERSLAIAVKSDEGPEELVQEADLMVDGTAGVREVLETLREQA